VTARLSGATATGSLVTSPCCQALILVASPTSTVVCTRSVIGPHTDRFAQDRQPPMLGMGMANELTDHSGARDRARA
jgi:hypothetical protein